MKDTDMSLKQENDEEGSRLRRFAIALLIQHPTRTPEDITSALKREPQFSHRVGDQRRTPQGNALPGHYRDTRWRCCQRHETKDQWFAKHVAAFVDGLVPHKAFLLDIRSTGGESALILQFLDDEYFGDDIPLDVLAKMIDLGLDLGIESYGVPQS
jgi:hypothetical protein